MQQDADQRQRGQGDQPPARLFACGVLAQELGVVLERKFQPAHLGFDRAGDAAQVSPLDVALHIDSP